MSLYTIDHFYYVMYARLCPNDYSRFGVISLGVSNKTIIPLALVEYEMVLARRFAPRWVSSI